MSSTDPLARLRHDLRTPVNHILGYSELLAEELADRGVRDLQDLNRIQSAARKLLELISSHLEPGADNSAPKTDTTDIVPGETAPATIPGRILIVDDQPDNCDLLSRQLRNQGHSTQSAANGHEALEMLSRNEVDLILLDVLMPVLDGFAVLKELKASPSLRHIPVIMISALDETENVIRCIEAGAEDYLAKPFNPILLRARIGACLEKKALRDQEQAHLKTIEETQLRLGNELEQAANYVRSILPPPMLEPLQIDWIYVPSTELGGDSFGYHWIDEDHLAMYLLDVCGHGVGAALLSVSALQMLRTSGLAGTDFRDPSAVLSALNLAFPMERQNSMYFTIWYGVYHVPTGTLRHSSGGHPPALLLRNECVEELRSPGLIIGVLPDAAYRSESCKIEAGSTLLLLCDGTYEIRSPAGGIAEFEEFKNLAAVFGRQNDGLNSILKWAQDRHGPGPLDDDFSMLRIRFS